MSTQPDPRIFDVPLYEPVHDAEGEVVGHERVPDAAEDFMRKMANVLELVGGTFTVQAERAPIGMLEGAPVFATIALVGRWRAFAPVKQGQAPAEPAIEEPAAEPAADTKG